MPPPSIRDRNRRHQRGFNLVELITIVAVLFVLVILLTIFFPNMLESRRH